MAWETEIQKAETIVGDIGRVFGEGKQIWDVFFPAKSTSAAGAEPPPEPVSAEPIVKADAAPSVSGSPMIIIGILIIAYLLFSKK